MHKTFLIGLAGVATVLIPLGTKDAPYFTLIAMAFISALLLYLFSSRRSVVQYLASFILLPLVFDIPAVHIGLWTFANPELFGIPLWLPFVYGNATLAIGHFRGLFL